METPGAYQLIDDETGEKFIVWGGIDDDSPVPSKDILSWKPNSTVKSNEEVSKKKKKMESDSNGDEGGCVEPVAAVPNRDDPAAVQRNLAGSFGKLKAQRVSALIKKVSLIKQDNSEDSYGKSVQTHTKPYDGSSISNSELQFVDQEMNGGEARHKRSISRVFRAKEVKDTTRRTETMVNKKDSDINPKRILKKILRDNITSTIPHDHDLEVDKPDVSVSRVASDSSLRGWGRGVSVYDTTFDSRNYSKQPRKISIGHGFFSRKSFKDLGCSDDVIDSLRGQNFVRPSHIQAMAFGPVIEGKTCIIADQSGSGKTLAYLAPVIQHLRQEELQGLGKSSSGGPRVVILVPTAELASQVFSNCRSMSKFGIPFRSMVATGGFRQKTQLENLQQDIDVLIATPGRFIFLLKEGFLQLTNLKCAVLDEVDILYADEDFQQVLHSFLNCAPVTTQYLFVTATLPVDIYNKLVEVFPDSVVIMGPGMHRTSSRLEEILVDCSGDDRMEKTPETAFLNKKSALLRLVEESPVSKTIIFCNKIETCRKVENVLYRFDRKGLHIRVLPFHSALAQESRVSNLKEFLSSQSKEDSLFLICTDRASRGIDFTGVDHVVLFDFPRDPSEYVRRVGRTARGAGGGKGKAFVFVVGKQVSLAQRIVERNLKGHPLHDVPSASYGLDWVHIEMIPRSDFH
ncbi:Helicase [Macleaya cordata]|uniref:Helicase n=1 Tax=Macleaya cordata TaxID=56857 RepID=A0A200Q2Z5_MACCD|nr:Helicase [Macleaya cordata]